MESWREQRTFVTNAHNGLSQRAKGVLEAQGHSVSVELALTQKQIKEVTAEADADVIICPFSAARVLKEVQEGYSQSDVPVIIVHLGVQGYKVSSSLWQLRRDAGVYFTQGSLVCFSRPSHVCSRSPPAARAHRACRSSIGH